MQRALRLSLGGAGLLFAVACVDQSGTVRTPTGPTGPALAVSGTACDNALYNTLSSKSKDAFSSFSNSFRQTASNAVKAIKDGCGTPAGQAAAFAYATLVIANKATAAYNTSSPVPISSADQARAQVIADLIDLAVVYSGIVSSSSVPSKSLLPGGGAKVCGQTNPGGECVLITEGYVVAGVVQKDLTAPTGSHLYTLAPGTCSATNLNKEAPYCVDLKTLPPASNFNPELQGFVCTTEQDHPEGGGDENNALVNVSHGLPNGTTEVLKKPTTGISPALSTLCTHGALPTYASAGFSGSLERFLARATNVVRPKMLYAINAGPPFTDDFPDGLSPLGAVNRNVFYDDFSTDVIGTQPAIQPATDVGSWALNVEGSASITVQAGLGDITNNVVVLNQSNGACTLCPVLSLVGVLANGSGGSALADVGTYVVLTTTLQNKPSTKNAPFILQSASGAEIARLAYVTENSNRVLKFSTTGDAGAATFTIGGQTATWNIGVHQDFEFTVNLDANTITLTVNGAATSITNVGIANLDLGKAGWIFGGIDAGIVAVSNLSVTRAVDP